MTVSVSQLNNYIHGLMDIDGVLSAVSVCGEVTNLKKAPREGWYFSLKDDASVINCFCYDSTVTPVSGTVVVVEGTVNYFVKSGSVSLFVRRFSATKDKGEGYQRFAELREKLKKEGLFDDERKKSVPHCCTKIGIVTSETGAVIHDITNVALRRQPFVNLFLYPVKVQGVGADQEIAQGINYFADTDVDVIIVGRGGGSNEDLAAFNEEAVVRAVAFSPKPIVSAVGHGVDYTLCDFAADKRAVTPSEAAEFVTIDSASLIEKIQATLNRQDSFISSKLQTYREKALYSLESVSDKIEFSVEKARDKTISIIGNINQVISSNVGLTEKDLQANISILSTLNPLNVLQRGYAYLSDGSGVIKSVDDVKISGVINFTLADGNVSAQVLSKEKK